jgi:excisionase family DNA binding protein
LSEFEGRWLSTSETGTYLGVSNDTINKWIEKQNMPAHRIDRPWKFKRDEVDAWVKSGGAAEARGDTHE